MDQSTFTLSNPTYDDNASSSSSSYQQHQKQQQQQQQTESRTSCPCKKLPLCLSSFTAAEYGDLHSLAKHGSAIVNRRDSVTGCTPLHLAAQHGHVAATSLLLQLKCPVDGTMLHRAAFSGAVATLRLLLLQQEEEDNNNSNSNNTDRFESLLLAKDETFGDLKTPLHKAAAGGRYLAVQLLLNILQERQLLQTALNIKDSNQQTPLEVALTLLERQEEERQSVARWDQVAGGVADWSKCVQLLQNAADAATSSSSNNNNNHKQQSSMQVPKHLTRINRDGCMDCTDDSNGQCLTASWQAAFQAALGTSVEMTLTRSRPSSSNTNQKNAAATTTTATSITKGGDDKNNNNNNNKHQGDQMMMMMQSNGSSSSSSSNSPSLLPKSVTETLPTTTATTTATNKASTPPTPSSSSTSSSSSPKSHGILCSTCGKPSIALYPVNGRRDLICKQCKRKL